MDMEHRHSIDTEGNCSTLIAALMIETLLFMRFFCFNHAAALNG